jgi:hypothetical protein
VVAQRSRDLRSIAAGGDNVVPGGQGRLGDVDAQASTSAGDEPNFLFSHDMFLIWATSDHKTESLPSKSNY